MAVATLSNGNDEIYDPNYYPSKTISKAIEKQLTQPIFAKIPPHLLAKGKAKALRLSNLTKA